MVSLTRARCTTPRLRIQRLRAWHRVGGLPAHGRRQPGRDGFGLRGPLGEHAEERAVAPRRELSGQGGQRGQCGQCGQARCRLAWQRRINRRINRHITRYINRHIARRRRMQHTAMHHAGQLQVVQEVGLAREDRTPGERIGQLGKAGGVARGTQGRARVHRLRDGCFEVFGFEQLVRRQPLTLRAQQFRFHQAHLVSLQAPAAGSRRAQALAQRRSHRAQGRPGVLHRQAARGHALVRVRGRARVRHADARQRPAEFRGHEPGERALDALADLDLAAEQLQRAVGVDPQPLPGPGMALHGCGQRRRLARVPEHGGRTPHRPHDARVGPAAAPLTLEGGPDRGLVGIGLAREQRGSRGQHAGAAVAALRGLLGFEGRPKRRLEPFDRPDLPALHRPQRRLATRQGPVTHAHGAGPALARAAALAGAGQAQVFAQRVEQQPALRPRERAGLAVDTQDAQRGHVGLRVLSRP